MATPLRSPHKSPATPGQQRASFLWDSSQSLATKSPRVAASLSRTCRDFCEANAVEPPRVMVERSCERCEQPLLPGVSCSVHVVPDNTKSKNSSTTKQGVSSHVNEQVTRVNNVSYNCNFCGHRNLKKGTPKGHVKTKVSQEFARSAMETISNSPDLSLRKAKKTSVPEEPIGKFNKEKETSVQKSSTLKALAYSPVRSAEISTEHFGTPEYTPMPFILGESGITPATDIESMKTPQSLEKHIITPLTGPQIEVDQNEMTGDLNAEKEDEENIPPTTLLRSPVKLADLVPERQDNGGGGESKSEASLDSWVSKDKCGALSYGVSNFGLELGKNSEKEEMNGAQNNNFFLGGGFEEPRVPLAEIPLTGKDGDEEMGVENVVQLREENGNPSCQVLVDQTILNDREPLSTTSKDEDTPKDEVFAAVDKVLGKISEYMTSWENFSAVEITKETTETGLEGDNASQETPRKKPVGRKRKPPADYTSDSSVDSLGGSMTPRRTGVLTRNQRAKLLESGEDEETHVEAAVSTELPKKRGRGRPARTPLKMLEEEDQELISDGETVVEKKSVRRSSRKPSSRAREVNDQVSKKIELHAIEKMNIEETSERVEIDVYEKDITEGVREDLRVDEISAVISHPIQALKISELVEEKSEVDVAENLKEDKGMEVANSVGEELGENPKKVEIVVEKNSVRRSSRKPSSRLWEVNDQVVKKIELHIVEQMDIEEKRERVETDVYENANTEGEREDLKVDETAAVNLHPIQVLNQFPKSLGIDEKKLGVVEDKAEVGVSENLKESQVMEVDNSVSKDVTEIPENINLHPSMGVEDQTYCQVVDGKEDTKGEMSEGERESVKNEMLKEVPEKGERETILTPELCVENNLSNMGPEEEREEKEGTDMKSDSKEKEEGTAETGGLRKSLVVDDNDVLEKVMGEETEMDKGEIAQKEEPMEEEMEEKAEEKVEIEEKMREREEKVEERVEIEDKAEVREEKAEERVEIEERLREKDDKVEEMEEGENAQEEEKMEEKAEEREEIVEDRMKETEQKVEERVEIEEKMREREEKAEEGEEKAEESVEIEERLREKEDKAEERVEKENKEDTDEKEKNEEDAEAKGKEEEETVEKGEKGDKGEKRGNAKEETEKILNTPEKVEIEQVQCQERGEGTEEGEFAVEEGDNGPLKEKTVKDALLISTLSDNSFLTGDKDKEVSCSVFEGNEGREGGDDGTKGGDEEKKISQEVLTMGNIEEDVKMAEVVKETTESTMVEFTNSLSTKYLELEKELESMKKKLSIVNKQYGEAVRYGAKARALLSLSVRMRQLLLKPKEENKSKATKRKLVASRCLEIQRKSNAGNPISGEGEKKKKETVEDKETGTEKLNQVHLGSFLMEGGQESQLNSKESAKEGVETDHMEKEQRERAVELPLKATESVVETESAPKASQSEEASKQLVKRDEKVLNLKKKEKMRVLEEKTVVEVSQEKRLFFKTKNEKGNEKEEEGETRESKRIRVVRTEWQKHGRRWKPVKFISYKRVF